MVPNHIPSPARRPNPGVAVSARCLAATDFAATVCCGGPPGGATSCGAVCSRAEWPYEPPAAVASGQPLASAALDPALTAAAGATATRAQVER